MNLGIILAIGESFNDLKKKGQAKRMIDYNIKTYSKNFDNVYIFSYDNEKWSLPINCQLVANSHNIPRIIYSILMPFINFKKFESCDILRCFQLTGTIPALVSKILLGKNFLFNFGYDYQKVAWLEGKIMRSVAMAPLTFLSSILADSIIVTNKNLAAKLPQSTQTKVEYIPNGVDTKLFSPKKTNQKRNINLLFIGRLEEEKNLSNLLASIKGLKNVTLTIIGKGSKQDLLKSLVKKLKLSVKFIPKVEYYLLPKYYRASDIFILPSLTEGHSKVLLEAQSCGLICIASDIPANKQIIKNGVNGILSQTDSRSLRLSILKVINNKQLRSTLQSHSRENALRNFEALKLIEKEVKLIKSLVK